MMQGVMHNIGRISLLPLAPPYVHTMVIRDNAEPRIIVECLLNVELLSPISVSIRHLHDTSTDLMQIHNVTHIKLSSTGNLNYLFSPLPYPYKNGRDQSEVFRLQKI